MTTAISAVKRTNPVQDYESKNGKSELRNFAVKACALLALVTATAITGLDLAQAIWPKEHWFSNAGPDLFGWHFLAFHPVRIGVVALALLLFSANLIYDTCGRLALVVRCLVFAASGVVIFELLARFFDGSPGLVARAIFVAVITIVAVVDTKIFVLHRYAHNQPGPSEFVNGREPLSSRRHDLKMLERMVRDSKERGRVIPISGRWGEGKTFLVDLLRRELDRPKSPALVVIDVWRLGGERDLQRAIIDSLLSHPQCRRRLRWVQIPLGFVFSELPRTVKVKMRAGFEFDIKVPMLTWQSLFEQVVRWPRHGVVIALDELDRAVPAVVQAALTLAKRSGSVPGVTILLPYTGDVIRYKAFNPMLPTSSDVQSSMEAVLYSDLYSRRQRDERLVLFKTLQHQVVAPDSGNGLGTPQVSQIPQGTIWKDVTKSGPVGEALLGMFAEEPSPGRLRLHAQFEEKYLGSARLIMRPLCAADVVDLVRVFDDIKKSVVGLLGKEDLLTDSCNLLRDGLERLPSSLKRVQLNDGTYPPVRVLHGRISDLLQVANQVVEAGETRLFVTPARIAALVIVAFDLAALIYGRAPESGPGDE